MAEWSPENESAQWLRGATGATPGATFKGTNRNGSKRWSSVGTIVEAEPGRTLAFRVNAGGMSVAAWSYRFEPTAEGCRVTEAWTDRRNPVLKVLSRRVTGVADRAAHNRDGMTKTLERLATAAEGKATAGG